MRYPNIYTREDMLDALRRHAVDGRIPRGEYDRLRAASDPSPARYDQVFGTWNNAVREAGLDPISPNRELYDRVSKADCVLALEAAAAAARKSPLTLTEYDGWAREHGGPSSGTIRNRVSKRWTDALREAGLPARGWRRP